jgi:hypothetical protein
VRQLTLWSLLSLCACSGGVKQVFPQLEPPFDSYDAGTTPVLTAAPPLNIDVHNVGRANLIVTNIRLTQTETAYSIVSQPEIVEAGENVPIVISFVPPKEQSYSATLAFDTDDMDNPSITVGISGQGSTRAVLGTSPDMIDFGRVNECASAVQTFTIDSKGTADLKIEDLSFTEGTSPLFTRVGSWSTPATVPVKDKGGLPGSITLTVKFTASAGMTMPATGGIHIKSNDPDRREVVIPLKATVNQAPIAMIAPLGNGAPGQSVMLDGSASMDPDGDTPLTYKWTLRQAPVSAVTMITAPDHAMTGMVLDPVLPGSYEVQLDVTDSAGAKNCMPTRQTIVAAPAQKLLVEMFWDNQVTDIDLHVLRSTSAAVGRAPDDCFYANMQPDWGQAGPDDDPQLLRDALTGYGPEIFGYVNPVNATYRVVAEFANEHLAMSPDTNVTIRVYLFGVNKFEQTKKLTMSGQRWPAVDIAWPAGTVTPVP